MRVLVRQQVAARCSLVPLGEISWAHSVFARLVMLEADSSNYIAQEQQEIVVVVVVRLVKLVCLSRELLVFLERVGRNVQVLLLVGEHIEMNDVGRRG